MVMLARLSLLLAGLFVCWITVPQRLDRILAGAKRAGTMISAIVIKPCPEARAHIALWQTVLWMLIRRGDHSAGRVAGRPQVRRRECWVAPRGSSSARS